MAGTLNVPSPAILRKAAQGEATALAALLAATGIRLRRKDYGWTEAIQPAGLCYEARGIDKGATLEVLARCTARERWA